MKSIVRSLSILSISTFLFLFISTCQQQPNEPATSSNQNEDEKVMLGKSSTTNSENLELSFKDNGGGKKGEDSIGIKALPCNMLYIYYWELERYETVPGKIVGIWPTVRRWGTVSKLSELKNKWGFNYIAATLGWYPTFSPYVNAIAAGYQDTNIMGIGLDPYDAAYVTAVNSRPPLWGYYMDEPITNHGVGAQVMMELASDFFLVNYPNSLFMSGETNTDYGSYIYHTIDKIFCTRYGRYGDLGDPDQRPLWDQFKQTFGTKFSMTWIAAHKDLSEYNDLLGHARNIGLNGVWLYQYQDSTDTYSNDNISSFSYNAWMKGWLKRFDRRWQYTYECKKADPCGCDPSDLSDGWMFKQKAPTSEIRELVF